MEGAWGSRGPEKASDFRKITQHFGMTTQARRPAELGEGIQMIPLSDRDKGRGKMVTPAESRNRFAPPPRRDQPPPVRES